MTSPVLAVRGLVVQLGPTRAVDGLDLVVEAGSVYALLGGNGAGKTTTLNALLGFARAQAGEATVAGVCCLRDAERARGHIAYLPENVALYPYLTGAENLRYFCSLGGMKLTEAQTQEALGRCGLPPAAVDRRVGGYSKGMRQKVGLAIAHAKQARLLLLDEPTSGLDPGAAQDLTRRLRGAARDGMAVLMVTHDLYNARRAADRIGVLRAGRKVAEVRSEDVSDAGLEALYLSHTQAAA